MPKLSLKDVILFADTRPGGAARVQFPTLLGCTHCGGLRGISVPTGPNATMVINDPGLAVQVSLVMDGYNLRHNEETAGRGGFRNADGHDGYPDDWQFVTEPKPCTCEQVHSKVA